MTLSTTTLAPGEPPWKVSNSEIQTFKDCRRRWYFNYYRRLQPNDTKKTGPLALGSRVHNALDDHYAKGEDLLEAYAKHLEIDKELAAGNTYDLEALESEGELGRIMLEGYVDWAAEEGIDSDYELISTEEELTIPLFDGRVELRGKLDKRVRRRSDGTRLFIDYKTSANFSQFLKTAHLNEQVLTYMILEASKNSPDDRSDGAVFIMLKKVKRGTRANPPFYELVEVRHNTFELRSFWQRLHGEIGDMLRVKTALDEGEDHRQYAYPRPSNDCTWKCPFYNICQMVDDGSAVEEAIANNYTVYDPNARYEDKKGVE